MVQALVMPMLGNTMELGVLQEWVVEEGGSVEADDVVAVVESEKTVAEVTADQAGVLARVDVETGEEVPPGTVIGVVVGPDESLADAPAPRSHREPTTDDPPGNAPGDTESAGGDRTTGTETAGPSTPGGSTASSEGAAPGARKLAAEHGVDLASVSGTGPDGAVLRADVQEHLEGTGTGTTDGPASVEQSRPGTRRRASPSTRRLARELGVPLEEVPATGLGGRVTDTDVRAAAGTLSDDAGLGPTGAAHGETGDATTASTGRPASDAERLGVTVTEERDLVGMRRTIAERMARSAREAPHVTLQREVSVGPALAVVEDLAEDRDAPIGFTDLLVGATVRALEEYPACNAWFEAGRLRLVEEVNVALAVDTESGLVTPVIREASGRCLEDIARTRRDLTEAVLDGTHAATDLQGGTFTVSNLGMFDVDAFDPIINPPQVAILGVGRIRERNGEQTCTLSLSFDHRVLDGADAARFLGSIVDGVESPSLVVADRAAAGASERSRAVDDPASVDDVGSADLDALGSAIARDLEDRAQEVADAHGWPVPTFDVELDGGRPVVTVHGGDGDREAVLKRLAYAACRESTFAATVAGLHDPELRVP